MKSLLLFIASLSVSVVAVANHHEGSGKCHEEVQKICKEAPRGRGGKMKCIQEHMTEFSADCQKNFADKKEKFHETKEACAEDKAKFCADVKPGDGRIIECFKKNEASLSAGCKEHLEKEKGEHRH